VLGTANAYILSECSFFDMLLLAMKFIRLLWSLVLCLALAGQEIPVIKANVRQVLVPVSVTDSKGRPVRNLKQLDFKVFEDGIPEEVVAFTAATEFSDPPPLGDVPVSGTAIGNSQSNGRSISDPTRTYLLCIDALHCSLSSLHRIRDAVAGVLRQERAPDSQYALMALGRGGVRVIHDSTRDTSAIAKVVRSSEFQKTFQDSESSSVGIAVQQFTELMRSYCSVCSCSSNNGGRWPSCPSFQSRVQAALFSFDERMYGLDQTFLLNLRELITAMATMPTDKTIVFISDGFNRFPGLALYSVLEGFGPKDRIFGSHSRDTQPELESVLKLATSNNIRFYTLDSRGVYNAPFGPGNTFDAGTAFSTPTLMDGRNLPSETTSTSEAIDRTAVSAARQNADIMAELAHETGGLFLENSNDLMKGLTRIFADSREYYLLAYVSKNEATDGKFRKIRVEVRNERMTVNAKAGYWALAR
jgi:VWFA-related protein